MSWYEQPSGSGSWPKYPIYIAEGRKGETEKGGRGRSGMPGGQKGECINLFLLNESPAKSSPQQNLCVSVDIHQIYKTVHEF